MTATPQELEGIVEADSAVLEALAAYREAKKLEDAAKAAVEKTKKALHEAFDERDARQFTVDGAVAVSRTLVPRTVLDQDLLAKLAPKAFAKARSFTESYRVTLARR